MLFGVHFFSFRFSISFLLVFGTYSRRSLIWSLAACWSPEKCDTVFNLTSLTINGPCVASSSTADAAATSSLMLLSATRFYRRRSRIFCFRQLLESEKNGAARFLWMNLCIHTWWHGPRGLTSLNCKWDEKMFMQKREKHTKFRESSTDLQMSQSKEKQRQAAFHVETFFIRRWKNARNEDNLARLALNKKPTLIGFNLDEMCEEKKRAMENCSRFFYWEMIKEIWIMIFTLMIHHQSIIRTNCWRLIAELGAVYCFNEHFSWSRHADVDFEDDDFRKIFNRPINASRVKPFGINCLDASLSVACQNDPCCANQLSRLHRNFVGFSNLRKVSL